MVASDVAADGLADTRARADEAGIADRLTTMPMDVGNEDSVIDGVCLGRPAARWPRFAGQRRRHPAGRAHPRDQPRTVEPDRRRQPDRNISGGPRSASGAAGEFAQRDRELQLHVGLVRPSLHGGLRREQGRNPGLHPFFGARIRQGRSACGVRGARQHQVWHHRRDWRIHSRRTPTGRCSPGSCRSCRRRSNPVAPGWPSPRAIAGVIAMLVSDDGAWITGTEIRIDGGTHA